MSKLKQRFWLIGLGSHMAAVPGDILDMPGAPEPVRLIHVTPTEARVATSAGESVVEIATVGIVLADPALARPRPSEGAIDHREHRIGALTGAGEEETFHVLWTADGFTSARVWCLTELGAIAAFFSCCADPGNSSAQVVRRRAGQQAVIASFNREGLSEKPLQPTVTAV